MTTPLPEPPNSEYQLGIPERPYEPEWISSETAYTLKHLHEYAEAYGAAEYKRGTEAMQAVTAERDALKQRQEGDALSIRCYQAQVDDLSKLLHQALDERDHYVKERDELLEKYQQASACLYLLKADAERYRWLRSVGHLQQNVIAHYAEAEMDMKCDAAMKGTS